jgi:hypothetical protein
MADKRKEPVAFLNTIHCAQRLTASPEMKVQEEQIVLR